MQITQYNESNYSFIKVVNEVDFSIILCDLGASIYSIVFEDKEMTYVPESLDVWFKNNVYHGKTIGRIPNRVKGNKVIVDDKEYILERNEGENTLHGGLHGLNSKVFDYEIEEEDGYINVVFRYTMKDLEDGLPGDTPIQVVYTIYEDKSEIKLEFFAKANKKTIFGLINHAYFNLGEEDLSTLSMRIRASNYLEVNPNDLLQIGKKPCKNCLNFKEFKPINQDINDEYLINSRTNGYDHQFYFDVIDPSLDQFSLRSSNIQMDVYTDFSCVQIYSDNYEDSKGRGTDKLRRRAVAVEPQESHECLHYLNVGELYHHFVIYKFRKI